MKDNWDLAELNGLVVAERRPLTTREKLDLREAKIIDAEYRLRRDQQILADSQSALAEEWALVKATQEEAEKDRETARSLRNGAWFLMGCALLAAVVMFATLSQGLQR